jgi:hypothetical protein
VKKINTLDNKELHLHEGGPNISLFIYGPKGGYYGSCTLDIQDIKDTLAILQDHLKRNQLAPS